MYNLKGTLLSSTLLVLLLLFINPYEIFGMPTDFQMVLMGVFTVVFMMFIAFIWQENPRDERESHHTFLAGRIAFLTGSAVLACGIIVEMLKGTLDIWLPIALASMIFSKILALRYVQREC